MIVAPYKRKPDRVEVAYLDREGVLHLEDGGTATRLRSLDDLAADVRVWASFDTVRRLTSRGLGEALCWNGEEIRWRHRQHPEERDWRRRTNDVNVLRIDDLDALGPAAVVSGLRRWRDWLGAHGAQPVGSVASASWSLLRATIGQTLYTPIPPQLAPPIRFTLGGRQEVGYAGPGRFEGLLEHVDMEAAYAREIGALQYGGHWRDSFALGGIDRFGSACSRGRCAFVRARVRVPDLPWGPLPRRPRSWRDPFLRLGIGAEYPTSCRMQGVWTIEEIEQAASVGCTVERIYDYWVHFAGEARPFAPWLAAVEQGRRRQGLAGLLAKMTGNALWGRFAMRAEDGVRSVRSKPGRRVESRELQRSGGLPAAHDLAETVSGRVRARLFDLMIAQGADLLCVHTDGGWLRRRPPLVALPDGWRVKERASRLDLLGPQTLRYQPLAGRERAVVAGVPAGMMDERFAELWEREGFAA